MDEIAVRSGRRWWAAVVTAVVDSRTVRVRTQGYARAFWARSEEDVSVDHVRPRSVVRVHDACRSSIRMALILAIVSLAVVATLLLTRPWEGSGAEDGGAAFAPGDRVEISWQDAWYDGEVPEVRPDGRYLVSFEGYDDAWNEEVGPKRLRPATPEEP